MENVTFSKLALGPRRGLYLDIASELDSFPIAAEELKLFEDYDLLYRALCGILYNFVPKSGHPGGSISSGRIVASLLFDTMDYDIGDPERLDADLLSYAAGHKAMGLYAMWALRNEVVRLVHPELLPADEKFQLRLEDLLGFRRNPTQETPLFAKYKAKPLDGHPTPLTPFVKLSTGASGVGVPASFGLAFGAMDTYGADAPLVNVLEGEGGMTAGRVSEALATMSAAQIWNAKLHVDWNQASIDSDLVCRDGEVPGDYVQWDPAEFCFVHDWNVIYCDDGHDFHRVLAAQRLAREKLNDQPTAVVYRTVKGWCYGIEGRKSHGAGHDYCCDDYFDMLDPVTDRFGVEFPQPGENADAVTNEQCYFDTLMVIRSVLEDNREIADFMAGRIAAAKDRLDAADRKKRDGVADLGALYTDGVTVEKVPDTCQWEPGSKQTLRAALGETLRAINATTGGAVMGASADLLDSTSISKLAADFPAGLYNAVSNPDSRLIAVGGICEDNMGAFMAGMSSYGNNIGAGSSYGAFIAALQHISARLHGIGQQARAELTGDPYRTWILVCAHAGLKTGEDGPTHADPQPLQLLQENFPAGILITLTPWDPNEMWPMVVAGLQARPAVLAPFVTRPNEKIFDREALGLPPVSEAVRGLYRMRTADRSVKPYHGTIILQGSGITNTFVEEVLPRIDEAGYNLNIFYVTSAELFSQLAPEEQDALYPDELANEAMGVTGFTLPTLYRWVTSREGRRRSIHAFREGHFLGSGQAHKVLEEARLHGEGQWEAIKEYAEWMASM